MDNSNDHIAYIEEMVALLKDEATAAIDFDQHRRWLQALADELPELIEAEEGAHVFRQDYVERIGGMVKAIAVVGNRHDGMKEALAFVESLGEMPAAGLVEQYRLTAARFRDVFPATFGWLPARRRGRGTTPPNSS